MRYRVGPALRSTLESIVIIKAGTLVRAHVKPLRTRLLLRDLQFGGTPTAEHFVVLALPLRIRAASAWSVALDRIYMA